MDLLIWNMCGFGNKNTVRAVNNFIHCHKPCVMALVEIKINGDRTQEQFLKFGFSGCFRVETEGRVRVFCYFGR